MNHGAPQEEPTSPGLSVCSSYKHLLIQSSEADFESMTEGHYVLNHGVSGLRFRAGHCVDCGGRLMRLEGLK